jgi:nitroreductase
LELTEAIYGRRATRSFTAEAVQRPILEALIDAAIQAPSAVNEQPWDFAVVQNAALLDRISAAAKAHMLKAMESSSFPRRLHENLDDPNFHVFYHAPALIVISAKSGEWAVEDAALAAENLMLAAYAHGLGSCWIGFAQRWLETADGKDAIGAPQDFVPIAPIIVGHPGQTMAPVPRNAARRRWLD